MEFEINGIKYTEIKREPRKTINKTLATALIMTQAFAFLDPKMNPIKEDISYSNEFLIKEYELIQNKKSNLSKSQRDNVVFQFERNFKKIG